MSALGDEGGVVYTAEIWQDPRIFWGTVEKFELVKDNSDNIIEGILTYKDAKNTQRLGSCRPIINLSQQKWIRDSTVRIYIGYTFCNSSFNQQKCELLKTKYGKSITQGVIEGINTNWTMDVVGRYFAVDDPSEYLDPQEGKFEIAPEKRLYRWYRIVKLIPQLQLLFVEVVIWGVEIGAPNLVDHDNYYSDNPKAELKYIIAPGAVVSDLSKGVNENDNNFGERKLILQPNGDFKENSQYKFEPGDEIEQAIGPSPWNPSGFRVRHFNNFPSLKEDASFVSENRGTSPVRYGLSFGGGSGIFTTDLENQYRRDGVAYKTGIMFLAVMEEGIRFKGEIKPYDSNSQFLGVGTPDAGLAIVLEQTPKKKVIGWTTKNDKIYATIGFDPDKENYYLRGAKAIEVENASLNFVRGLSATEKSANNLCEVDVPVEANSKDISITFKTPEIDPEYGIQITPSWLTVCAVTDKTKTGFKILFEKSPSEDGRGNGKIDWFLAR
jgi:hypothetical protein